MESNTNWIYLLAAIGGIVLVIYVVLPKLFKNNYNKEKILKMVLACAALGYLAYDNFLKEKYLFAGIMVLGAVLFTYLLGISKRKS